MNRLKFLLNSIAAILLASLITFTSCDKEEQSDPPAIPIVKLDGKVQDKLTVEVVGSSKNVMIVIDFQANAGIKRIDVTQNGEDFIDFPQTSGFISSTKHTSYLGTGVYWGTGITNNSEDKIFVVKVTDNKNRSAEKHFTVSFFRK